MILIVKFSDPKIISLLLSCGTENRIFGPINYRAPKRSAAGPAPEELDGGVRNRRDHPSGRQHEMMPQCRLVARRSVCESRTRSLPFCVYDSLSLCFFVSLFLFCTCVSFFVTRKFGWIQNSSSCIISQRLQPALLKNL